MHIKIGNIQIFSLDLPEDVRVVRTWVDHEYRAISFLLESESFDEVEEGYRAPEINYMQVTIKKHDTETVNETPLL